MSQMIPEELEEFVTITIPQEMEPSRNLPLWIPLMRMAAIISLFPV